MKKHKQLIYLISVCCLTPVLAYIAFFNGMHGYGFTNKGEIIKPLLVDKSMDKYLAPNTWGIVYVPKEHEEIKLNQIKRALGIDGRRVRVYKMNFSNKELRAFVAKGYSFFIADPQKHFLLKYKRSDRWQRDVFHDLKTLLKVNP